VVVGRSGGTKEDYHPAPFVISAFAGYLAWGGWSCESEVSVVEGNQVE
jgi:hypothetical protein